MAIITISRGTMSGGRKLADMLTDELGYRCISREIIIKAADDYGVSEAKLFEAVQKSPSIFQKMSFERERYLAYIQASLCECAKDDNLIYHGNGGHFLLPDVAHVLRLRLIADMPYRIKAASEQLHMAPEEAAKYIERVDKERAKWTSFLYGKDWGAAELYDIVFNLSGGDIDFACAMTAHAVRQPHFQTTPESKRAMEDLLTASRVRAALAAVPNLRLDRIAVRADGHKVSLAGRVKTQKLKDAVFEAADLVPDVESIDNNIEVDYRSYGVE